MTEKPEIKVKSIRKTIDVLNCFIVKQPLGVTEISEKLGLYKSNVHSILSTLTALEYLDQDPETGKYYLGIGILRLGRALGNRYSFHKLASPHMQTISNETGEIVYLTVPFQNKVYYLDTAFPSSGVPHLVGSIQNVIEEMNCTSSGKAMLAFMPNDFIENYLAKPMKAQTENTITDPDVLRKELESVRRNGYATDNMEAEIGISCVAVPIRSSNGNVLGAMSVSGPSPRFGEERVKELADMLKQHVYALQKEL